MKNSHFKDFLNNILKVAKDFEPISNIGGTIATISSVHNEVKLQKNVSRSVPSEEYSKLKTALHKDEICDEDFVTRGLNSNIHKKQILYSLQNEGHNNLLKEGSYPTRRGTRQLLISKHAEFVIIKSENRANNVEDVAFLIPVSANSITPLKANLGLDGMSHLNFLSYLTLSAHIKAGTPIRANGEIFRCNRDFAIPPCIYDSYSSLGGENFFEILDEDQNSLGQVPISSNLLPGPPGISNNNTSILGPGNHQQTFRNSFSTDELHCRQIGDFREANTMRSYNSRGYHSVIPLCYNVSDFHTSAEEDVSPQLHPDYIENFEDFAVQRQVEEPFIEINNEVPPPIQQQNYLPEAENQVPFQNNENPAPFAEHNNNLMAQLRGGWTPSKGPFTKFLEHINRYTTAMKTPLTGNSELIFHNDNQKLSVIHSSTNSSSNTYIDSESELNEDINESGDHNSNDSPKMAANANCLFLPSAFTSLAKDKDILFLDDEEMRKLNEAHSLHQKEMDNLREEEFLNDTTTTTTTVVWAALNFLTIRNFILSAIALGISLGIAQIVAQILRYWAIQVVLPFLKMLLLRIRKFILKKDKRE